MAFDTKGLDDYIDVSERIALFNQQHPTGSLQQVRLEFVNVGGEDFVVYTAAAYRTPEDIRPGIGTAWEPIPGKTPYTKGSEVQNAETAAWGRAIVAIAVTDTKRGGKIASMQEVRNRQAERDINDVKSRIRHRLPNTEVAEIKRLINVFVGTAEDFDGEHSLADLRNFLESLPVPAEAQAAISRAIGPRTRAPKVAPEPADAEVAP